MKIKLFSNIVIGLVIVALLPLGTFAQNIKPGWLESEEFERVGMSGWQFLKIPTDARTAAIGGVTTVLSRGDASSALANPASIADISKWDFSATQMTWIADIQFNSASVVKNFGNWGFLGINLVYLDYGTMTRTVNKPELDPQTGIPTGIVQQNFSAGTFSGGNLALGLAYSRQITDRLQVGGNIRFISETLDNENDIGTSNWSLDIGTVYYTGVKTLRLAMTGRNFGPDAHFTEYSEQIQIAPVDVRMPMVFALGAAVDILEGKTDNPHLLTTAVEFTHPNDGPEKLHVGAEYAFKKLIFLRGGYRFNYDEMGLTLGTGVNLFTSTFGASINYAFMDFGRLDQVHMFSVGINMD